MHPLLRLLPVVLVACGPPADPEGTTEAVRGGTFRLGWIGGADPRNAPELAAARKLAESLDAEVEVVEGGVHQLVGLLENGEIHAIGGELPENSPLSHSYGMSRPIGETTFLDETERTVLAVRKGENGFLMRLNAAILAVRDGE